MSKSSEGTLQSSALPLNRVFDKIGFILCHHQLNNQLNMKMPNVQNQPIVWSSNAKPTMELSHDPKNVMVDLSYEESMELNRCRTLVERLEKSLREAKLLHLQCGEVLLPHDLTWRIARDVVRMSEFEPCGLRGCNLYIHVEDKKAGRRRIGVVKCDPATVATFELHLTLVPDTTSWLSLRHLIPNKLLKSLGKRTTLVISDDYRIDKKKLYRSGSL